MKPALLLPLVLLVSVGASVGTTLVVADPPPANAGSPAALAGLDAVVARVEEQEARLGQRLDDLSRRVDQASAAAPTRLPEGEIVAAVERYLEGRGAPSDGAAPQAAAAAPADERDAEHLLDTLFGDFVDPELSEADFEMLWKRANEEGLADELLARVREWAAGRPGDPEAQVVLGKAFLQKTFEAGAGPAAGRWAIEADKAFDTALEADDHHWEARAMKAISLSFWPPAMGKQGEAIQEFETLLAQQQQVAPAPKHAQTYLFLGNLYQQTGNPQKALETWQAGLALFPGDASLQEQLAANGGGN